MRVKLDQPVSVSAAVSMRILNCMRAMNFEVKAAEQEISSYNATFEYLCAACLTHLQVRKLELQLNSQTFTQCQYCEAGKTT